jgi:hypothetical protein
VLNLAVLRSRGGWIALLTKLAGNGWPDQSSLVRYSDGVRRNHSLAAGAPIRKHNAGHSQELSIVGMIALLELLLGFVLLTLERLEAHDPGSVLAV